MTSNEIRTQGFDAYATAETKALVEVLTEIAAQLAEANEIQRSLFGPTETKVEASK